MEFREVLKFWFEEIKPEQWFKEDCELDNAIADKFGPLHHSATQGELEDWRDTPRGRLAEIIVLDQFSRNIYRDDARAFAWDGMALVLSQEAIKRGCAEELSSPKRAFLYMPFMHSESPKIHRQALELFSEPGLEYNLDFEKQHKAIIDRFGRYPHRNKVLSRESTPEEVEFLKQEDSLF